MGSRHVFKRWVSQSSRNWPEPAMDRPLQDVRQTARYLSPPITLLPAVVWADPRPVLPDGGVGFLTAIQSNTKLMAAGLCAYTRGVPHGVV